MDLLFENERIRYAIVVPNSGEGFGHLKKGLRTLLAVPSLPLGEVNATPVEGRGRRCERNSWGQTSTVSLSLAFA